jgi:hypothetical protein
MAKQFYDDMRPGWANWQQRSWTSKHRLNIDIKIKIERHLGNSFDCLRVEGNPNARRPSAAKTTQVSANAHLTVAPNCSQSNREYSRAHPISGAEIPT